MNWTLIPVCSNLFPSFGRIVTAPFTDSPSLYSGAFSLRPFSVFISTICRSSPSSRTISISTGVEKKYAILPGSFQLPPKPLGSCVGGRASLVNVGLGALGGRRGRLVELASKASASSRHGLLTSELSERPHDRTRSRLYKTTITIKRDQAILKIFCSRCIAGSECETSHNVSPELCQQ